MHTSLRIKKVYMDQIREGTKKVEYRKDSPFYHQLFSKKITSLTLHYQRSERLTVEVKHIRLIRRPVQFHNDEMLPTKRVFAISLGRILKYSR